MFDLVPLARARGKVTDRDRQPCARSELLEFPFPQPDPWAVAAPCISRDEERRRVGIGVASHACPPSPNGVHGKTRRVMIDAHTPPALVAREVVDAIRYG